MATPEISRRLAGAGEAAIVPLAGHMVPIERPKDVAEVLLSFLDRSD